MVILGIFVPPWGAIAVRFVCDTASGLGTIAGVLGFLKSVIAINHRLSLFAPFTFFRTESQE
jgi:hypothetical protein